MKKLLTFAALIGMSVSLIPMASGDVPEENFYPSVKQEAGWMGYNTDNSIEYAQPSSLYAKTSDKPVDPTRKMYVCTSLQSSECTAPEIVAYFFNSIFCSNLSRLMKDHEQWVTTYSLLFSPQSVLDS